jgi:ATP-dependent exoDNAse (exonuclease V) beta subunit
LTVSLVDQESKLTSRTESDSEAKPLGEGASLHSVFPLIRSIEPQRESVIHRFSVTQLINYQRCPRQYYFDRALHVPSSDEMAVWNDAEAPEPPANLTATLKGAVIHRFCETYKAAEDPAAQVRSSLEEIISQRQAELADRLVEIDRDAAVREMLPLAENYISSKLFSRVEAARRYGNDGPATRPWNTPGLWSELSFRLRRPAGVFSGTIDKLLISRSIESDDLDIEIIDFKTNRLGGKKSQVEKARYQAAPSQQIALDFMNVYAAPAVDAVTLAAQDYQLQMQAYALAVRSLIPSFNARDHRIAVTLHFLEPNVEFRLPDELLQPEACAQAIDQAMTQIISSLKPEQFPVKPALHCRMCNFLGICPAGREQLAR